MITIAYQTTNNVPRERLYEQLKSMLAHLGMQHHHLLLERMGVSSSSARPPVGAVT
jgi:hypothetical protein